MSRKTISFGKIGLAAGAAAGGSEGGAAAAAAGGFGTFGRTPIEEQPDAEEPEDDAETQHVHSVMGIKNFGKKAKSFDITEMMARAKEVAREAAKKKEEEDQVKAKEEQAKVPEPVPSDEDEDLIGPPLPPGLNDDVGPPPPPGSSGKADEKADDKTKSAQDEGDDSYDDLSDSSDDDDQSLEKRIPISEMVTLQHGGRAVSALAVDPAGARLASGSVDYDVCLWDFAGMDSGLRPFRTLRPADGQPVAALRYSASGHLLLAAAGAQARLLDRDGQLQAECAKGDQYLTDMARTKGHTAALSDCCWHPTERAEFLTAAADGSLRTWSAEAPAQHRALARPRAAGGLRARPTACAYSRDGRAFAAGCFDGSLQLWDPRRALVCPTLVVRAAHAASTEVTCVAYSHRGQQLVTRANDHTMKLWDVRAARAPVLAWAGLPSRYDHTDAGFSPDDRLVFTAASRREDAAPGEDAGGRVVFMDARGGGALAAAAHGGGPHAVRALWHPRLDQLAAGWADGAVRVWHAGGARGAAAAAGRARRRRAPGGVLAQQVLTPHALPLFRQERLRTGKKQQEKDRADPVRSHRPDLPITAGRGGRVAGGGSTLSSFVIRNLGLSKRVEDDWDPREAILRYAAAAAADPFWVSPAYKRTQPVPIFQPDDAAPPAAKKTKD